MVIIARRPRFDCPGITYHVIQRGNNKEYVFDDPDYKDYFVSLLRKAVQVDDALIHAFVVMSNHYHLALRVNQKPLSKIMHRLNTAYSVFYNMEKKRTGHVFQGRYMAIPILNDTYLLAVIRYIHRNPVAAQMCRRVEDYRWSSDLHYRGTFAGFVESQLPLGLLANEEQTAREQYRAFVDVDDGIDWEDFTFIDDESVELAKEQSAQESLTAANYGAGAGHLGPKSGKINLSLTAEKFKSFITTPSAPAFLNNRQPPSRVGSLEDILIRTGISSTELNEIKSGSRQRHLLPYKIDFAREAFRHGYSMKQIAQHINLTETSVYHYLNK